MYTYITLPQSNIIFHTLIGIVVWRCVHVEGGLIHIGGEPRTTVKKKKKIIIKKNKIIKKKRETKSYTTDHMYRRAFRGVRIRKKKHNY
jgi:hypothetical protein